MNFMKKVMGMIVSPLSEGEKMPSFSAKDHQGNVYNMPDYLGQKPIVIYFYPKDDTPGCTKQACSFRDLHGEVQEQGAILFGVSFDSEESHKRFSEKHDLNFPLLLDPDRNIAKSFGVSIPGNLVTARYTFVADKEGIIRKVLGNIPPHEHANEVVKALKEFNGASSEV